MFVVLIIIGIQAPKWNRVMIWIPIYTDGGRPGFCNRAIECPPETTPWGDCGSVTGKPVAPRLFTIKRRDEA